jgi:hypothetical protein
MRVGQHDAAPARPPSEQLEGLVVQPVEVLCRETRARGERVERRQRFGELGIDRGDDRSHRAFVAFEQLALLPLRGLEQRAERKRRER